MRSIRPLAPPIEFRALPWSAVCRIPTDRGDGYDMTLAKLGLRLVRQIVEQGLKGTLTVSVTDQRANVTRVEFDIDHDPPR